MSTILASDAERKAQKRLKSAANVTLLIALISILVGVLSLTLTNRVVDPAEWVNLPVGAVLLALSFVIRRRSTPALWIAIGIIGTTGIVSLINFLSTGQLTTQTFFATVVLRVLFMIPLFQGIGAISTLNQTTASTAAPQV